MVGVEFRGLKVLDTFIVKKNYIFYLKSECEGILSVFYYFFNGK